MLYTAAGFDSISSKAIATIAPHAMQSLIALQIGKTPNKGSGKPLEESDGRCVEDVRDE